MNYELKGKIPIVIALLIVFVMFVVFSTVTFGQEPPATPPVGHTGVLPTPPGTELVDAAPVLKSGKKQKKVNKKHKSGLDKILEQPNLDH